MRKRLIAVLTVVLVAVGLSAATVANGNPPPKEPHKVYVCKYVGTPGVDEVLQTGQNPIEVDAHAIDGDLVYPNGVGFEFEDQQGRSLVIGWVGTKDVELPVLTIEDCPVPPPPDMVRVCDPESGDIIEVPKGQEDEYLPVDDPACDDNPPGPEEVRANVTFTDPTCDEDAAVNVKDREGVNYALVGEIAPGSTVTVTATAEEGFELVGQTEWTHTFADAPTDCDDEPNPPPEPPDDDTPDRLPHTL